MTHPPVPENWIVLAREDGTLFDDDNGEALPLAEIVFAERSHTAGLYCIRCATSWGDSPWRVDPDTGITLSADMIRQLHSLLG